MLNRIIPVLLLKNSMLYKSVSFKDFKYVGDPINAVRIFNEKEVDELIILDTDASKDKVSPNYRLIESIASEAFMPIGYGGGVSCVNSASRVIECGVEKVIVNTVGLESTEVFLAIAKKLGSQSTVAAIDLKKSFLGKYALYNHATKKTLSKNIPEYLEEIQQIGVGEIILNSVSHDGAMKGYDIGMITAFHDYIHVPIVVSGGAGSISNIKELLDSHPDVSAAAGSMFVFHGKHKAVLITYPSYDDLLKLKVQS